ncbi:hypothetical protein RB195_013318 [Necator americanus]|uniref:Myb-like DNA-binding domain protein n=1 Tax=Necator americanus TaxID=51031 RepID=A0ABR1DVE0_NECAM
MQFAIVFFRQSETAGVVSRSDLDGEFKVNAAIKARWECRWYAAKILFIGSKRLCESKVDFVTTSGNIVEDNFDISRSQSGSPIESRSDSPESSEILAMERFRNEVIARVNNLQNRMLAPSFEFDMRSQLQSLKVELRELKELLRNIFIRLPPPPITEELRYDFVSQKNVEMIKRQKKGNKNLFALALEKEVYVDLKADLVAGTQPRGLHPYTPPPILSPMRNGSGLFWQIAKNLGHPSQAAPSTCSRDAQNGHAPVEDHDMSDDSPGLRIVDEGAGPSDANGGGGGGGGGRNGDVTLTSSTENAHPARKNGFICSQATFADELEALRKISYASTASSTRSAEEILRKHSMDPDEYLRKASCISDYYYDVPIDTRPKMSDAIPHINIGREYQARVRKWNDRKIHDSELEAIEDRDEIVFSPEILRDIEKDQIEAFELLACSQAIPRPGRNKELALHLLMENKGNIEAAVADLLRSDTLDWEQYQIIYGSTYLDSTQWTPEEVNAFQDAIYKTEKDFHQVAQELPSKTVRECVEFYYTWKKACPDDYRKLRNLRRKRQLLELNLQQMDEGAPAKKVSVDENVSSDAESDATAPSYCGQDLFELRGRTGSFISQPTACMSPLRDPTTVSAASLSQSLLGLRPSPPLKDLSGLQRNYQPSAPRSQPHASSSTGGKKGAQPSADGFFHCRLCDKCFEKVKSLNAHMKSHAMKARAEAEAKAQVDAQLAAQSNPVSIFQNGHLNISGLTSTLQGVSPSLPTATNHAASGLSLQQGLSHSLLSPQGISLPHPRPQHPLLSQVHSAIIH